MKQSLGFLFLLSSSSSSWCWNNNNNNNNNNNGILPLLSSNAFIVPLTLRTTTTTTTTTTRTTTTTFVSSFTSTSSLSVLSPFSEGEEDTATASEAPQKLVGPLDLTWDNVDAVLDEMRPYLIQDGGNVEIQDIDGPVVKLELTGACGTCPSSTQTMKMGLERGLREKIPEIQEVIQAMPEGPPLEIEQVDVVLDGVRPFLQVAGGSIDCKSITGEDSLAPTIVLQMLGASASLNSVKLEIQQRLQRHFMISGLRVDWL